MLHLGQIDAQPMQREFGDFSAEDLMDLVIGEAIVRMGSAREAFNVGIPLLQPQVSHPEAIIATSKELYCRPRAEVEALLGRTEPSRQHLGPNQWRMLEYLARVGVEIAIRSRAPRESKTLQIAWTLSSMGQYIDTELLRETKRLFAQRATAEERARVIFAEAGRFKEELT